MLSTCVKSNTAFVKFIGWYRVTDGNVSELSCVCIVDVYCVTQLHDVVYMLGMMSSTILRFNATTHERLTDITIRGLIMSSDIVACEQTSQLYVADFQCVRRMSADGAVIKVLLSNSSSDMFRPSSLSVASSRLLVTSHDTKELIQLDSLGDELRRFQLPDHMEPWNAVESPTATFIVSHKNTQLDQYEISEVNADCQVLRQFTGSRLSPLRFTPYIAIDSRGNLFVAGNHRILLLDAQLKLRRLITDKHQFSFKQPRRLCYGEQTGQLLVGLEYTVAVFDVLHR